jgi:hypothetical protein
VSFITWEVIAAMRRLPDDGVMTAHRILKLNALTTAVSAVAMLLTRPFLYSLFGLESPALLDAIAIALLAYAALVFFAARQPVVGRAWLIAFTISDGLWVVASAIVLIAFWSNLEPLARVLVIVTAIVVDGFAMAQLWAARST